MNETTLSIGRRTVEVCILGITDPAHIAAATDWSARRISEAGFTPTRRENAAPDAAQGLASADCLIVPQDWLPRDIKAAARIPAVVFAAIHDGLAVIAFDRDQPAASRIVWTGFTTCDETLITDPDIISRPLDAGFAEFLASLHPDAPAQPKASSQGAPDQPALAGMRSFLTAQIPRLMLRMEYQLLLFLTIGRRLRKADLYPHEGSAQDLRTDMTPEAFQLAPVAARADVLANVYAQKYRSSAVGRFTLSAFAAVGAALIALLLPDAQSFAYVLEVVATVSIIVSFLAARRDDWQGKWLEYRYLAERLRLIEHIPQASAVLLSGRRRRADVAQGWTDCLIDRAARHALDSREFHGSEATHDFSRDLRALTDDQIAYNRATVDRMSKMETRLGVTGILFFATSMLLALIALALKVWAPETQEQLRPAIAGALAFFPALGAALFGIRVQLNFKVESVRARDVLTRLETLRSEMEADDAPSARANIRHAWRLVEILKGDLELWRNEQIARAIDLP